MSAGLWPERGCGAAGPRAWGSAASRPRWHSSDVLPSGSRPCPSPARAARPPAAGCVHGAPTPLVPHLPFVVDLDFGKLEVLGSSREGPRLSEEPFNPPSRFCGLSGGWPLLPLPHPRAPHADFSCPPCLFRHLLCFLPKPCARTPHNFQIASTPLITYIWLYILPEAWERDGRLRPFRPRRGDL